MASTSTNRVGEVSSRIKTAVTTLSSDNQDLLVELRKVINKMPEIAVEMEKRNRTQEVKELEDAVLELLQANEECKSFSIIMQSVGDKYQPSQQLTDFKKVLDDEKSKVQGSTADLQKDPLLRRFKEAVWNVHHAGQPLPGEEDEEMVMATTQIGLLNTVCPISGKAVTDLSEPVRSTECKHIFEKSAILHYIRHLTKTNKCPVAGCSKPVHVTRIVCDTMLPVEIDELRSQNKQTNNTTEAVEDFTTFSSDEDSWEA